MDDPLFDVLLPRTSHGGDKFIDGLGQEGLEAYLDRLRSFNSSSIRGEASHLETCQSALSSTLESLAYTGRDQILLASSAISQFAQEYTAGVTDITNELSSSLLPELLDSQRQIAAKAEKEDNEGGGDEPELILRHADKINDILDLPSLILSCIRGGYYSEALELVSHSRRLSIRFQGLRIIDMVMEDVNDALKEMTSHLLRLLRTNTKLPNTIKVISYLSRLPPFHQSKSTSRDLQHIYLISRLAHLRSQIRTLDPLRPTPEAFLKKYIETFRDYVLPTIFDFNQVFPQVGSTESENGGGDFYAQKLISEFLRQVTQDLGKIVSEIAPQITDRQARISIWLQILYCAQSFGRAGGDFWSTMLVESAKQSNAEEWINAVNRQRELAKRLREYK